MTLFESAYDWIVKMYHTRDLPKFPYELNDETKKVINDYYFGMERFYVSCETYDFVTVEILDCDWWYKYTTDLYGNPFTRDMFNEFLVWQNKEMKQMYSQYFAEYDKIRDHRYKAIPDWLTFIRKKFNMSPFKDCIEWKPSISLSLFKEWCDMA